MKKAAFKAFLDAHFRSEAKIIYAQIMGADSETSLELSLEQEEAWQRFMQRYSSQEPLAYILGSVGFWNFDMLKTTAGVLIPRPDTETLVRMILDKKKEPVLRVLEMGTGSGAIVCALATERPRWCFWATDKSPQALSLAQENAAFLGIAPEKIQWIFSDWFSFFAHNIDQWHGFFDLIVVNPPYLDRADPHCDQQALAFEPDMALYSGQQGYADLFWIIEQARSFLKKGGALCVEHGFEQAPRLTQHFAQNGYQPIESVRDYSGHPRAIMGTL